MIEEKKKTEKKNNNYKTDKQERADARDNTAQGFKSKSSPS